MKFIHLIFLVVFLVISCSKEIGITTINAEKININESYIKTTGVETGEKLKVAKEPGIEIISPKDGGILNSSRIVVLLNISNFNLVTPDMYPKKGQGHVQVWMDDMEFRGSKNEFVFKNESNGTHVIKAELMISNNTLLPYSNTIRIIVK